MVIKKTNTEVKITLIGMDTKNIAIFKMAIKMHNKDIYLLVGINEEPDIIIVDVDNINGHRLWKETSQKYANTPIIYNSSSPPVFDAIFLPKPITINSLFPLIKKVLEGEGSYKADEQQIEQKIEIPKNKDNSLGNTEKDHFVVKKRKRDKILTDADIITYQTDGLLLALQEACKSDNNASLIYQGEVIMLIFPKIKKILLAIPPNNLKDLCDIAYDEFSVHYVESKSESIEKACISFESCLWQVALWTANGRLNINIKPDTILSLKQWPNMTRVAYIPDSMRLAAFLIQSTASLNMLYKLMNIELKDLINFISVTHEVGILELDAGKSTASTTNPLSEKIGQTSIAEGNGLQENNIAIRQKYKVQSTGMLQKLMSKLTNKK